MSFELKQLWCAPAVNPYNRKAKSIPVFNPVNEYGRVFLFPYLGFFVTFWSWYAFPPLLSITIKKVIHLSQNEVANSNTISLTATLLVRLIAGPLCDRFGPRLTFAGLLLTGTIPMALAGTAHNAASLYAIRFFIGILGGTFVPYQVWTTGFFDRNIVGTANALVGGWGNSGGGIAYFGMPAIFDSLVHKDELTPHVGWRVSYLVPFILIIATALGILMLTEDAPAGKWAGPTGSLADTPAIPRTQPSDEEMEEPTMATADITQGTVDIQIILEVQHEVIQNPTFKEGINVLFSHQTAMLCSGYICSFGGELAINSILGAYYLKNFKYLGQTQSGRWAAMFGLLNVITRPLGGFVSNLLYKWTNHNLWAKKLWIHFLGVMSGTLAYLDTIIGLIALMAISLEADNGANFALVAHVHPFANGTLSGIVGASGNFGGINFAIIFRYNGTHCARVFWIMGAILVVLSIVWIWARPIRRGQIGGR